MEEVVHVFYTDNAPHTASYHQSARDVIRAINLVPLIYRGITLATRRSNADREIRDDFYKSKVVSVLLGVGDGWADIRDNWVLPELAYAASAGMQILVYLTEEVGQAEVDSLGLPVSYRRVSDEASLAQLLADDLGSYTASQSISDTLVDLRAALHGTLGQLEPEGEPIAIGMICLSLGSRISAPAAAAARRMHPALGSACAAETGASSSPSSPRRSRRRTSLRRFSMGGSQGAEAGRDAGERTG